MWQPDAHAQAVVEIEPQPDGELPATLIQHIYCASQRGLVVLALRNTNADAIDRVLDDLVHRLPLSIPGVLYVDADDEISVLEAAHAADMIFAATSSFRTMIESRGVNPRHVHPVALALKTFHDPALGNPQT